MSYAIDEKTRLRRRLRSRRKAVAPAHAAAAAACLSIRLSNWLAGARGSLAGKIIGGYWPQGSEFDIRLTLSMLISLGATVALPAVARGQALTFRRWTPGMALEAGNGCRQPPADAKTLVPALLLVPLLGFDGAGNRLGQGGGYYDRTLAAMRAGQGSPFAVGIGYDCQKIDILPVTATDQPMDAIATESGLWLRRGDTLVKDA